MLGEAAVRLRQPAIVGEILAGILLGPTIFGMLAPDMQVWMFPTEGPAAIAASGLSVLAITLFLIVAGMEIDLSAVWRQGKSVLYVGGLGMLAPFLLGFLPALAAPSWFGAADISPVLFASFVGIAMAITALPVIAKILLDLKLFHTDVAVTIVSAAIVNDLLGWIAFAFILSLIGLGESPFSPVVTGGLTLAFAALMLTVGRWAIHKTLPWIQAHSQWPAGVLAFAISLGLMAAAFTEWIGVHAIFGAFLLGIAIGDSSHLRQRTRKTIDHFVSSVFAPIFFAGIGLKADFAANFDLPLVLAVLAIATVGKVGAGWAAAKWCRFTSREAWAIGFGMNARGAMEIVLGLLALEAGVINEKLFVALVVMAIVTSTASGLLVQRCLGKPRQSSFLRFLTSRTFVDCSGITSRVQVMERLAEAAATELGLEVEDVVKRVRRQQSLLSYALGNGVAVPHIRVPDIDKLCVAMCLSPEGIDFDSPDGQPVHAVFLIISQANDPVAHLGVLRSIAQHFAPPDTAKRAAESVSGLIELKAFLRVEESTED